MPLTFLAEGFPLGGLIFIGAIVALILFAVIASVIKRAGRARAMKELAEREGWSYAASDKDVARCLATFSQLRQAPRNLLVFRRGELAITFGDITLSQPTRVNNKRNTSAGRAASFCQIEGRGLDAPNLSLMKKPEIPPQLAKMMGSLAKVDIEGLMGAASIAPAR